MFKVFDAQGNYLIVHHEIDAKSYVRSGSYVRYTETTSDENEEYSKSNTVTYVGIRNRDYLKFKDMNKFKKCECYTVNNKKSPSINSRFLTIIGTAECVKSDIKKFGIHGDIAVVNDAAFYFKDFQHFITVHGRLIPIVEQYRKSFRSYENNIYQTHSAVARQVGLIESDQNNADYLWEFVPVYRSSGIFAIWVGLALGYKAILVHGVPLEEQNHFYDFSESYVKPQFNKLYDILISNVDSLSILKNNNIKISSGKLCNFTGKPTKKWINDNR